jgi:ABC-type glycerol-3-phosphate transport system substrate-binding protein
MYPNIRESLTFDGNITAIPYNMNASTFGVNLKTLEEIGLTKDDAPRTYFELLEFIERWIDEYSAEYPDIKLFEYCENLNHQLMYAMLSAQVSYCNAQGEPLTFDTPVMRKLLAKLESIDFTPLSENVSFEDESDVQRQWEAASSDDNAPLFTLFYPITIDRYLYSNWEFEPAPLALDEGMPVIIDAQVSWLVFNQKAADSEEAMRLIQYYAENMNPEMRVNTMPDENEPIENSHYTQSLVYYQEQLGILESLLEITDEGTKPFIETDIQRYKELMETKEQWRWLTTPEDIARYRSLYDYVSIAKANLLFSRYYEETSTLLNRYIERQIKGDQFIMELSQKLRMMQMEG